MNKSLSDYVSEYQNTCEHNDLIWNRFEGLTDELSFLKEHRDYIEKYDLGFGDRAFHYMWHLLFNEVKPGKVLEIGVYKGQVISLSKRIGISTAIDAISPFEGNMPTKLFDSKIFSLVKSILSPTYRRNRSVANYYEKTDYLREIEDLFQAFDLPFDEVNKIKGLSQDPSILQQVSKNKYDMIYIDGNHRFEYVAKDISTYCPLIVSNGYLVMDDASFYLPSSAFWKGHEEVSRACNQLEHLGFENILNVGHNRIFKKM